LKDLFYDGVLVVKLAITQSILVILSGIYAIRASWFIFSGIFSPLTPVAAIVLVLCITLFHRPPIETGIWLYVVLVGCVVGAIANGMLLFSTHEAYSNLTNRAFSIISVVSWVCLCVIYIPILIRSGVSAQ
jgi:hypothetical protein